MHSLARLVGYNLAVVPFAPYTVSRMGDGHEGQIVIEHGGRAVLLDPRDERLALGGFSEALLAVAEVTTLSTPGDWVIETSVFRVSWPNHYALVSPTLSGCPFALVGADGSVIYTQRPRKTPARPDDLVAPGQRLVEQTNTRGRFKKRDGFEVVLAYEHAGNEWRQLHSVRPSGIVVSAQALKTHAGEVFETARLFGSEVD